MPALDVGENLGRGALARTHRAVHVAVPVGGGLAAHPVDPAHRRPDRRAEPHQRSRAEDAHRAAPGPRLGHPAELEVLLWMESPVAKDLLELGQDLLAALPRRGGLEHARTIAADEPHDDPGLPVRRRDVEASADRPLVAQELTGEAVLAPERLVAEDLRLAQGAPWHPLGRLVAGLRQARVVPDPPPPGRR